MSRVLILFWVILVMDIFRSEYIKIHIQALQQKYSKFWQSYAFKTGCVISFWCCLFQGGALVSPRTIPKTINKVIEDALKDVPSGMWTMMFAHAPRMPGTFSPPLTCRHSRAVMLSGSLTRGGGKTFPAFPAHAQPALLCIWYCFNDNHWCRRGCRVNTMKPLI